MCLASIPVGSFLLCLLVLALLGAPPHAAEISMANDPKGFQDIPWEAPLAKFPDLILVDSNDRIKIYERKSGPASLGEVPVEFVRLSTIDDKFARVTVRYHGKDTHARLLAYLQSAYGPLDRTPESMMRGLNQEFHWRGGETEVSLVYDGHRERGHLFIESRTLAPNFLEAIGGG